MELGNLIVPSVKNVPPSGIRKFFDMVNEMKDAISLSIGEPDFQTPTNVRNAGIKALKQGLTGYSPNTGFMELREEISKYMKQLMGVTYNPKEEILVSVGGSEALDLAIRTLIGPGDEVIVPEPNFVAYKPLVQIVGGMPVTVSLESKSEFKLTPDLLEKAITNKTKALILSYPNNPTGAIMTREELAKIVAVLEDKNIVVIADEVYAELTYTGKHASIASFPQMRDKTIVINSFSKAFAMTGWRLGYALGHKDLIEPMNKIHQFSIMSAPTVAQYAALEALKNAMEEVRHMVSVYDQRRKVMVEGFRNSGLECFEPQGAFYVFPSIQKTGLSSTEFCERLLLEEKVAVIPGNAFGESGEGFIRACYAYSIENIQNALLHIKRFVDKIYQSNNHGSL